MSTIAKGIVLVALSVVITMRSFASGDALPSSNPMATNFISVRVNTAHPGATIPETFLGLSFDAATLLPCEGGRYYFSPTNTALFNLIRKLEIKSLRIGGNTSDRDAVTLPSESDIDSLFAFARVTGVKVI